MDSNIIVNYGVYWYNMYINSYNEIINLVRNLVERVEFMKKRMGLLFLVFVVVLGSIIIANAETNVANGYHVNRAYYTDNQDTLVVEGKFYNVGNTKIFNFKDINLSILDKNGESVANAIFNDDNLFNSLSLEPGEVESWVFSIKSPEKDKDLSEFEWDCEFLYNHSNEINLDEGIKIYYNSNKVEFDSVKPRITEGRTLVPVRFMTEAMGCELDWNDESKIVTVVKDDLTIKLPIDSKKVDVNGKTVELDVPAKLENGRTIVPLRFILETFGCDIFWGGDHQIITISN